MSIIRDFFDNDKQYTLRKGLWSHFIDWAFGEPGYQLLPNDDYDDDDDYDDYDELKPPAQELKKEPSLLLAWARPILHPTQNEAGRVTFREGGFFLAFTAGLGEAINFTLDYLLASVITSFAAVFALAWYHATEPPKRVPLSEIKKSHPLIIAMHRLASIFLLVPVIKWLWRTFAIALPAALLAPNRIYKPSPLGFYLGVSAAIIILLAATVLSGGAAGAITTFLLGGFLPSGGAAPVVLPAIAAVLHTAGGYFGIAGAWMAAHWFAGLSLFSFMAPLIQGVLLVTFAQAFVSLMGGAGAFVFSGANWLMNKMTCGRWNKSVKYHDDRVDRAFATLFEMDVYQPRSSALSVVVPKKSAATFIASPPGSPDPDVQIGRTFERVTVTTQYESLPWSGQGAKGFPRSDSDKSFSATDPWQGPPMGR